MCVTNQLTLFNSTFSYSSANLYPERLRFVVSLEINYKIVPANRCFWKETEENL